MNTENTVYYAHCIAIYNTPQEVRDVELLTRMGFTVVNPNTPEVSEAYKAYVPAPGGDKMDFFKELSTGSKTLVFRALPDGSIPAGVAKEIKFATEAGIPVLELPSNTVRRELTLEATRQYLREIGQR